MSTTLRFWPPKDALDGEAMVRQKMSTGGSSNNLCSVHGREDLRRTAGRGETKVRAEQ